MEKLEDSKCGIKKYVYRSHIRKLCMYGEKLNIQVSKEKRFLQHLKVKTQEVQYKDRILKTVKEKQKDT